ncbi:MAG: aspartate aminotransferase family protein [Bacteroidetes bacterium]|nr:aspartate aminotransferase family protein [Bacteroidota bacterium]
MDVKEFRKHAHEFADWMADYLEKVDAYPVKSNVLPGDIYNNLPGKPPQAGESMYEIMKDFEQIVMPGITHWQSPNFFAYFPANSSYPSVLAEMLTATIGAQCMIWETSPAAAELEERVMNWLKEMIGLPAFFEGVIQDTASASTLAALLTAREKTTRYRVNKAGLRKENRLRVYCSTEAHSSIEKAVKIAGLGKENLVKVETDDKLRIDQEKLELSVMNDLKKGYHPMCVVATIGTTGTTAIDPMKEVSRICKAHNLWLHVDAALAGTALLLPEFRWMIDGIEQADSFVFNPHKWMFTNFDCSAYFVKEKETLLKTFEILPEYLKTKTRGKVNDYRDWGVPLGRRFRGLKLWFVIRSFGVKGLQEKIRFHVSLAQWLKKSIEEERFFELMAPVTLNTVCFRFNPNNTIKSQDLNNLNETLLNKLNKSGKLYLTHTKIKGNFVIRMVVSQTYVTEKHVKNAWERIKKTAQETSI